MRKFLIRWWETPQSLRERYQQECRYWNERREYRRGYVVRNPLGFRFIEYI
jgi:hypothetical protein